jgi:hypothetical protein
MKIKDITFQENLFEECVKYANLLLHTRSFHLTPLETYRVMRILQGAYLMQRSYDMALYFSNEAMKIVTSLGEARYVFDALIRRGRVLKFINPDLACESFYEALKMVLSPEAELWDVATVFDHIEGDFSITPALTSTSAGIRLMKIMANCYSYRWMHGKERVLREKLLMQERLPEERLIICQNLAAAAIMEGKADYAVKIMRESLQEFTVSCGEQHGWCLIFLGIALREANKYDEAYATIVNASKLGMTKEYAIEYSLLMSSLLNHQRSEKAEQWCEFALNNCVVDDISKRIKIRRNLNDGRLRRGKYQEAMRDLMNPINGSHPTEQLFNTIALALCYMRTGNPGEGLKYALSGCSMIRSIFSRPLWMVFQKHKYGWPLLYKQIRGILSCVLDSCDPTTSQAVEIRHSADLLDNCFKSSQS